MLDEPIHLAQPNESWAELAAIERARLAGVLGIPLSHMQHIGSTAVAGLLAKPILDLQLGVEPFPPRSAITDAIVASGYTPHGEAGVPGRLYFTSRQGTPFNLHVVQFGGDHWVNNLLLREYLARTPEARERYASAKLAAVKADGSSLLAYSAAKSSVVVQLLAQARAAQSAGQPIARGDCHRQATQLKP
jgi:GrpB-like predicted nucleotidyltransferase (UPF0157 family)